MIPSRPVLVAAPNRFHYPITAAALKAGKHVLMEKPLASTVDESQQLVDLVGQTGLDTPPRRRPDQLSGLVCPARRIGPVPVIVQDASEEDAARVRADLVRWSDQASVR